MKIGVVGLGAMGGAFAGNLLKAGHQVLGWNRSRAPLDILAQRGGLAARSIEEAFAADVTLSMLADDEACRALFLESGLLDRLPAGTIHVNMATISVVLARELAEAHAKRGLVYVAAPVLGNAVLARDAKVHVLVAGPSRTVEFLRPILAAIGQSLWPLGEEPHKANVAKLAMNLLLGAAVEALSEAVALGRSHGIEPERLVKVLTNTTFSAPAYRIYGDAIAREIFEPPNFRLRLEGKDITLALAAAREAGLPLPLATVVHDAISDAVSHGDGDKDLAALSRVMARHAAQG
ncbi:MAG TPA: NAD(P)-dependent oxidoreductase [Crenalkalicoccus sp.]|nr:NAD(P)-dependent oxidoreductase [Crenalkalicoccus sp.]